VPPQLGDRFFPRQRPACQEFGRAPREARDRKWHMDGYEARDGLVRIGVNTGEAPVRLDVDPRSGEGFATGDTMNTAARLEAAAPL
jgi:class 3 adenylate cyclase